MSVSEARSAAICETMAQVKKTIGDAEVEDLLRAKEYIIELAQKKELFPVSDVPRATVEEKDRTFCLYKEDDGRFAMYVNVIWPGVDTVPHDHGNSWAIVAAIEGQEKHEFYRRLDDGSADGHAEIEQAGEIIVEPGAAATMQVGGIHSIEAVGTEPSMLLHCYGYAFEVQTGRKEFDVANNTYSYSCDAAGMIEDLPLHPDVSK